MRNLIVELQIFKADYEKLKKSQQEQQEINEVLLRSIVTKKIPKDDITRGKSEENYGEGSLWVGPQISPWWE